jgi:hypothetical protein
MSRRPASAPASIDQFGAGSSVLVSLGHSRVRPRSGRGEEVVPCLGRYQKFGPPRWNKVPAMADLDPQGTTSR